ncbi:Tetratricopeptide repeat protein [Rubripirellula lacrimiformis]|uniref:Tetratricopeptide repeat protein n=1 Tax=Rubripirellula lacrimiformis TaxID=1930273 RepID=A0A517N833_9BACT|nr:hypothetical protein [Rubripirellula lacrimiformis]QDT03168.1 Tetratricopeptide repeat protein [Rubripirellula lacrimiformis]
MPTPSENGSDTHLKAASSASFDGQSGRWELVEASDLPRISLDESDGSDDQLAGVSGDESIQSGGVGQNIAKDAGASVTTHPLQQTLGESPTTSVPDGTVASLSMSSQLAEPNPVSAGTSADQPKPKLQLQRRQQLEHHLKANPADLDSFLELARIYRDENHPIDARRVLQQALQIFPDDADLLWEFEEATLSRSLQQLREVSELASRLDTAETDRELSRCQQDWAMRRIEVCQSRINRDPSLVHLRVTLGEAMYEAERFDDALDELDPVLRHWELSPSAYLIRGKCLLAMGKDLDAMVAFRACALRRAVVAPLRTRVFALRLLCETADRLGIVLTLAQYRSALQQAEQELAKQAALGK